METAITINEKNVQLIKVEGKKPLHKKTNRKYKLTSKTCCFSYKQCKAAENRSTGSNLASPTRITRHTVWDSCHLDRHLHLVWTWRARHFHWKGLQSICSVFLFYAWTWDVRQRKMLFLCPFAKSIWWVDPPLPKIDPQSLVPTWCVILFRCVHFTLFE